MLLTKGFDNINLGKKNVSACRIEKREDLDQTASEEAVCSGYALFVYAFLAGIFGRMVSPRGPMLLTKGFDNIDLGKKNVCECRIANREDTDQTASFSIIGQQMKK